MSPEYRGSNRLSSDLRECGKIYPFTPGDHGIDFSSLFDQFAAYGGPVTKKVNGGSGAILRASLTTTHVAIDDINAPDYTLKADSDHGYGLFSVYTKPVTADGTQLPRHPDLFGAAFIDMALPYFAATKAQIHTIRSIWTPTTINHRMFLDAKNSGATDAEAIRETWSGQLFARHGFTVSDDYIIESIRTTGRTKDGFFVLFKKGL